MAVNHPCTVQQMSKKWGITPRRVSKLCEEGRIEGIERFGNSWMIPGNAPKPDDGRQRSDFDVKGEARPFIKWAGGKGQLLETIRSYYPEGFGEQITKYAEPFIGGGAVLFDILNKYGNTLDEVYISDINKELIDTYSVIKEEPDTLIEKLKTLQKEHIEKSMDERKTFYLKNRARYNEEIVKPSRDRLIIASELIYLNKTCFNGLYRVNSKGLFNVPSGLYKNPMICDETNIIQVSQKLQNVIIKNANYKKSSSFIDENTFVYFDPPYRPLTASSNFTSYTEMSFNDDDQKELVEYVHELSNRGAKIAVSNSDPKNTDVNDNFFDDIYDFAIVNRVQASRMINSKSSARGKISEILVTNYPKQDKTPVSILEEFDRTGL